MFIICLLVQKPCPIFSQKGISISHIHHSRINWLSRTQPEHILQALCLAKITDFYCFKVFSVRSFSLFNLMFQRFLYRTVEVSQIAEYRAIIDETFQPVWVILRRIVQVILDVFGTECCHARLGSECVVGDGECIGVKHPYWLSLAVYRNLFLTSDNHKFFLLILTRSFFAPCSVLYDCIHHADHVHQ